MISRGHYIGEIVDELSIIAEQVKLRNKLGMMDLTVLAENFFRDILNAVMDINLINLNENRSNEPGLDLGDEGSGIGIQVTSRATSEKINETLNKITSEQAKKYGRIVVLVIGKRQGTYTIDDTLASQLSFNIDNIWDLDEIARKIVSLDIDRLQVVHRIIRANTARLRIDLEIPDDDGKYPTSNFNQWEPRPISKIGTGQKFLHFIANEYSTELSDKDKTKILKSIKTLSERLSMLPRITREFLAMLYEYREEGESRRAPHTSQIHLLLSKVDRQYRGEQLHEELGILEHAGFVGIDGEDAHEFGPPEIFVSISRNEDLQAGFVDFIQKSGLNFRKVIGEADFSDF